MKKNNKKLVLILIILIVFLVYSWVVHERQASVQNIEELNLEELAIPKNDGRNLVGHVGYTLCYSEEHEQPLWVAYVLTPQEVHAQSVKRKDNFRSDPAVPTGSAVLSDYKSSGYDRGHMAPFADLSWSEESGSDSFYLSNMSPQNGSLNRGKWAELEALVRTFADKESMCVVTGPVLTDGPYKTIGKNKVSVPNYYYKVILDYVGNEIKAIGFILPNEKCEEDLSYYAVSVDEVENITGLDFFFILEDSIEEKLESEYNFSDWL